MKHGGLPVEMQMQMGVEGSRGATKGYGVTTTLCPMPDCTTTDCTMPGACLIGHCNVLYCCTAYKSQKPACRGVTLTRRANTLAC